jgi:hypothetical protein
MNVGSFFVYDLSNDSHCDLVHANETGSFESNLGVMIDAPKGAYDYWIVRGGKGYTCKQKQGKGLSKIGWFDSVDDLLDAMAEKSIANWHSIQAAIFLTESPEPVSYVYTDLA